MFERTEINLAKLQFSNRQDYFWRDAALFFRLCGSHLRSCVEKLDPAARGEFESGNAPTQLLAEVRAAISIDLKSNLVNLPPGAFEAAVRKALPNERDHATLWNCLFYQLHKLPKRILAAYEKAVRALLAERHDAFFNNVDEAQMADYLRAWQSCERASARLIVKAMGQQVNPTGTSGFGAIKVDEYAWALRSIETTKNLKGRGVPQFLDLATAKAKTGDRRAKRFFKNIPEALQSTKAELDWEHWVPKVDRLLASFWCNPPCNLRWLPPLCLFEARALANFCNLCLPKKSITDSDIYTKWKRLGLKSCPQPRITSFTVEENIVRIR